MTDPSALALIDIEHNLVFAHVLTTTTAGLSAVSSSELVALPLLVGTGTSLDFHLDGHHAISGRERTTPARPWPASDLAMLLFSVAGPGADRRGDR